MCAKMTGGSETARKVLKTTIWIVSTARNAIVVIICTIMAFGFDPVIPDEPRNATFILTGDIDAGLPPFQPPPFSTNDTTGHVTDFKGMISELGSAIAIIPLLAILENVAIAKAFCKLLLGFFYMRTKSVNLSLFQLVVNLLMPAKK